MLRYYNLEDNFDSPLTYIKRRASSMTKRNNFPGFSLYRRKTCRFSVTTVTIEIS